MDSFQKLMPILFLILWMTIAILGKKKKKQAPSSNKEKKTTPANPFGKLQNTFKDLLAELEQPAVETELPKTPELPKTIIPEVRKTKIEKEMEKRLKKEMEIKLSDTDIKPSIPKPQKIKPSYQSYTKTDVKTAIPVKKLREAVIWSEILGKPVSIRDE